jgi:RNA polymerase-binding transcription factor
MTVSIDHLKAELERQRDALKLELSQHGVEPNDGMGYGMHPADDASLAFDQTADLAIRRNAERLLYQVERALYRMEEGTYGICRECGNPIDDARLKAIPWTRLCIDCASKHEE